MRGMAFVKVLAAAALALAAAATPAQAAGSGDRLLPGQVLYPGESIVSANNAYRFTMQTDGNAVVYTSSGTALWHSYTHGYNGTAFAMQGDGNVVMYHNGRAIKATNTAGRNNAYLIMQTDGNLVLYSSSGQPLWNTNTWGGRIAPLPSSGAGLCARVGYSAGFRDGSLQTAVAVALGESSCVPNAVNHNTNGSWDAGLWQINSIHGYSQSWLFVPQNNANAAWRISSSGTSWRPWVVYTNGAYRNHLNQASAAIFQL
ncbi:transglycosylase SLT domain-containing protein [Allorhizocola rhizosphaerae]|uniref:transglycosylase SLT domain-containing protein n=1 Tax=Allorhizocola rhizosphaerae TaxID=1872709 RepID=UPI0013C2EC29|nr:transglycosylase SLT domain-containing protein [Allorhizocola rhizosphaerae]